MDDSEISRFRVIKSFDMTSIEVDKHKNIADECKVRALVVDFSCNVLTKRED